MFYFIIDILFIIDIYLDIFLREGECVRIINRS